MLVSFQISHPGYATRTSEKIAVAELDIDRRLGGRPSLDRSISKRGVEYTAEVVTQEGQPAANAPFEFRNGSTLRDDLPYHFSSWQTRGRTDSNGRIHFLSPPGRSASLSVTPDLYAPLRRRWGYGRNIKPDFRVPDDLGRLVLDAGIVISGRLLDLSGRPLRGQKLVAMGTQNGVQRNTTTDANGRFTFAPVAPGNYLIHGDGQYVAGWNIEREPLPPSSPVIKPVKIFLAGSTKPEPIELHEVPTVSVEIRHVDSQGRPAPGPRSRSGGHFRTREAMTTRPLPRRLHMTWGK